MKDGKQDHKYIIMECMDCRTVWSAKSPSERCPSCYSYKVIIDVEWEDV